MKIERPKSSFLSGGHAGVVSLGNLASLENLEQVDGEWDVERLGSLRNFDNPLLLSVKNTSVGAVALRENVLYL